MNILLVSAFSKHHPDLKPGNYLQKTGDGLKKAFEALGHSVDCFDYREIEKQSRKADIREYRLKKYLKKLKKRFLPEYFQRLVFRVHGVKRMNEQIVSRVRKGDYGLVLLTKTELVDWMTVSELNACSPTWYFFMDPYQKAQKHLTEKYAVRAARASATRSAVVEFYAQAGAQAVLLTQGADTDYFYQDSACPKDHDVVFVGTVNAWRRKYIDYLEREGISVETYGKGGKNPFIGGKDLGDLYRSSKIVLDFQNRGNNTGFSLRVFEVMGSGAFLCSEYTEDTSKLFQNGKELVWFRTPEECADLIRRYLENDEERTRIAETAADRVGREFTWKAIAGNIVDRIEEAT